MVYLFAVSMVALGGYVYLLVTINQQQQFADHGEVARRPAAPRRQSAPARRYVDDDDGGAWDGPAPRRRQATPYPAQAYAAMPGSGQSGRISYGSGAATHQARRDPRDPYGREAYGWDATRETTRRAPARNGRHATGQVPVQRTSRPEPATWR
jgi:hypothetical protein